MAYPEVLPDVRERVVSVPDSVAMASLVVIHKKG